jgi:hypothetical protein
MTYLQFTNHLAGFDYYDKKTNKQVYRFILFLKRLTPEQCKKKYNTIKRNRDAN